MVIVLSFLWLWVFQEGFGLSCSPVLYGLRAGLPCGLIRSRWLWTRFMPKQAYSMVPACDILDHRAGACYLPCGLLYNELCHTIGVHSLSIPPSTFWMCIILSQSRLPSFLSKTGGTLFTNCLLCWSRNSMAKCSGQLAYITLKFV